MASVSAAVRVSILLPKLVKASIRSAMFIGD